MSVYHWLVCEACKEKCHFTASHSGDRWYGDGKSQSPRFLHRHSACLSLGAVRIVSEHDPITDDHDENGLCSFDRNYEWFREVDG